MKKDVKASYQAIPGIKKVVVTPESLIKLSAKKYGITIMQMMQRSRQKFIVESRQYAMYLIRKELGYTQQRTGSIFKRDHATVYHAEKTIRCRIELRQLLIN